MIRGTLLSLSLASALVILACGPSGGEESGQPLQSEAPTVEVTATPTEVSLPQVDGPVDGADVSNTQLVALGEILYQQYCASCHGAELEGQANWKIRDENGFLPAPPHDETGHTWHHPDEQLFEITKIGTEAYVGSGYRSNMIGFGDQLDDTEIWAVLAYIKSQWPARTQRAQPK
ncbi:MAG: c-type cytochrome [Caldilineaceae bacterium SB0670_bin_27]|uniref:C-type cytochrome n=1 Tax=Caldilineaceae bacterium SB0664_bin_27 TaxID=2605260 RepID=A0A6B0YLH6_9CHLR|nr:c-type cytochrome [Caldilineaceae bacterium SB0664_bin_27]MYJ79017.1 c-type cytochrome [Caldilineaceae bacterium SB0670_bin_27]